MANIGKRGMDLAIGIMLVILVGAAILPTAIDDWFNATTGDWGTGAAAVWPLIPLLALVALVYFFYNKAA